MRTSPNASLKACELWLDHNAIWLNRSPRRSALKNRRARDDSEHTKAAMPIWQPSTPARAMLVPESEEYDVIASERIQQ